MSLISVGRRAGHLILVLFLVSLGTFLMLSLTPGDPAVAVLGDNATPEAVAQLDHELGLDQPILSRYVHWISGVLHGNLGESISPPGGSVVHRIAQALPVSLELALLASVLALVLSIPIAAWSAVKEGGYFDRFFSGVSFTFLSIPPFVSALVLALIFALQLGILPRAGWVRLTSAEGVGANLTHALLPALSLALVEMAVYTRILRADMIQTLKEDFVLAANAKGVPFWRILFVHTLRPSSLSLVTLAGISLARLIGGTVLVETIFGLPGVGQLLVQSSQNADYPLVQGIVLLVAATYVLMNTGVDALYSKLDPRTRRHVIT
jgi:peptide/nickel transport system permease protein